MRTRKPKVPKTQARQVPRDLIFYDPATNYTALSESWEDFFNRLRGSADSPPPIPSAEDIRRAIHFWHTYPGRWAELQQNENNTVGEALVLNLDHGAAQRLIMAEAERRGIPSAAIRRSGALCREGLANCPAIGAWPHVNLARWPECLRGAKKIYGLSENSRRSIREAEDVIARLEAMLDTEVAEAGAQQDDYYPPVYYKPYKIKPSALRAAHARGDIKTRPAKPGSSRHHYCFADVRKLWPERLAPPSGILLRQNATSSATKRHNA